MFGLFPRWVNTGEIPSVAALGDRYQLSFLVWGHCKGIKGLGVGLCGVKLEKKDLSLGEG
jgi:hypothetical protein